MDKCGRAIESALYWVTFFGVGEIIQSQLRGDIGRKYRSLTRATGMLKRSCDVECAPNSGGQPTVAGKRKNATTHQIFRGVSLNYYVRKNGFGILDKGNRRAYRWFVVFLSNDALMIC